MDGFGRVLKDVGEADVELAFTETDGGIERGEAAKADVQRRDGSAGAELSVLLLKEGCEGGGLEERGHSFPRLAREGVGEISTHCIRQECNGWDNKASLLLLDSVAFGILLRRVGCEPSLLLFNKVLRIFAKVANRFQRELAGDVVGLVVCGRLDDGRPAVDGA